MSSPKPPRPTFIVPPAPANAPNPSKPRESVPFTIVPTALAAHEREALEPHWLPTIDAATD